MRTKPVIIKEGEEGYTVFFRGEEKLFKTLEKAKKYKEELEINHRSN